MLVGRSIVWMSKLWKMEAMSLGNGPNSMTQLFACSYHGIDVGAYVCCFCFHEIIYEGTETMLCADVPCQSKSIGNRSMQLKVTHVPSRNQKAVGPAGHGEHVLTIEGIDSLSRRSPRK